MIQLLLQHSPGKKTKFQQIEGSNSEKLKFFNSQMKFVNREKPSNAIIQTFVENIGKSMQERKVVTLLQSYGIGKTELIRNFQKVRLSEIMSRSKSISGIGPEFTDELSIIQSKMIELNMCDLKNDDNESWARYILKTILGDLCLRLTPSQEEKPVQALKDLAQGLIEKETGLILFFDEFFGASDKNIDEDEKMKQSVWSVFDRIQNLLIPFIKQQKSRIHIIIAGKSEELFFLGKSNLRKKLQIPNFSSLFIWEPMLLDTLKTGHIADMILNTQLTHCVIEKENPIIFTENQVDLANNNYTFFQFLKKVGLGLNENEIAETVFNLTKGIPRLTVTLFNVLLNNLQEPSRPQLPKENLEQKKYIQEQYECMIANQKIKDEDTTIFNPFDSECDVLLKFLIYCGHFQIALDLNSLWNIAIGGVVHELPLSSILMRINLPFVYDAESQQTAKKKETMIKILLPVGLQHLFVGDSIRDSILTTLSSLGSNSIQFNSSTDWELFERILETSFVTHSFLEYYPKKHSKLDNPEHFNRFKNVFKGLFSNTSFASYEFANFQSIAYEHAFNTTVKSETEPNTWNLSQQLKPCAESLMNLLNSKLMKEAVIVPIAKSSGFDFRIWGELKIEGQKIVFEKSHLLLFQAKLKKEPMSDAEIFKEIEKNCRLFDCSCGKLKVAPYSIFSK